MTQVVERARDVRLDAVHAGADGRGPLHGLWDHFFEFHPTEPDHPVRRVASLIGTERWSSSLETHFNVKALVIAIQLWKTSLHVEGLPPADWREAAGTIAVHVRRYVQFFVVRDGDHIYVRKFDRSTKRDGEVR